MHTDAILPARRRMPLPPPSDPASDPTEAVGGLAPIDQIRQRAATALFGAPPSITQVGRFQIQKLLGAGGMGVVFAAHDPQLGRVVALKLLQPMSAGEHARERLQREAQAMARLQHPNVVGVFEAGIHGDQVYVAMEYVEGGTFGDWLRVRPRPWTEVVDMLCQAGDGLVAAHQVGLVHRDFKPANILISAARARISDFGLARPTADASELERTGEDDGLLLASPLTRTGALIGTPAYMAPELLHGAAATPASDQFAFGVVLFEACHGHRPFLGDSIPALLDAIASGKLASTSKTPIPASLTAIIRRALDRDPTRRFPDMPALLTSLRAARRSRLASVPGLRGMAVLTSALAVAGGLTLAALSQPDAPPSPDIPAIPEMPGIPAMLASTCDSDPLAGIWDPAQRDRLAAILPTTATSLLPALDDYATQWRTRHTARCTAASPTTRWADSCLADRRSALADLVTAVIASDDHRKARAQFAAELLPALVDCDAPSSYTTLVSEPAPDLRAQLWLMRIDYAALFQPRIATRPALVESEDNGLLTSLFTGIDLTKLMLSLGGKDSREARASAETMFVVSVRELRTSLGLMPTDPVTVGPRGYEPFARLRDAGLAADAGGFADLSARAFVLAAEVLAAGPHADDQRRRTFELADAALERLPDAHPLRLRLRRDLGYIALAHARHITPANSCADETIDFTRCGDLFAATRRLTAITREPAATPTDRELLARAHEYAGNLNAATVARAGAGPLPLLEAELGYLDFSRATVVPSTPLLTDRMRCNADLSLCEIDRAFLDETQHLLGAARAMASVKDGVARGTKLYGLRPDTPFSLLGFKNGDLILEIGGTTFEPAEFLRSFQGLLTAGGGTIRLQRKGEVLERRFVVK